MEVNTRKGKEGHLFALFSCGNQITIYTKVILGMENCFALSYNDDRKKEDIALMAEMKFKCFRMSISWSRIFPNGDDETPNEEGIEFYDKVFDELHKYGIEPVVTMCHFDMPVGLAEKYEGWLNEESNPPAMLGRME